MMRRVPLLLFLLSVTDLKAEEGIVLMNGQGVANATVTILGHSGSARTDAAGRFRWNPYRSESPHDDPVTDRAGWWRAQLRRTQRPASEFLSLARCAGSTHGRSPRLPEGAQPTIESGVFGK